ncbi:rhodanese-like domain-containing protein [Brevibacillus porteri]|uniref:rhodanese-like domain-containing protein n=1 Tax=Brevibacillus porteri TaxID=2126350 RepID=UPI0036329CBE
MSLVLQTPAASPEVARTHFLDKLSLETDVADVWNDIQNRVEGFYILDARSEKAYRDGHVPGALNLPHSLISTETTAALDRTKLMVVYCWGPNCNGAAKACAKLAALGFRVKEMLGGFEYWKKEGNPLEH